MGTPKVTAASRDDSKGFSAMISEAAATTTSVALCGMAPCPPTPCSVTVA